MTAPDNRRSRPTDTEAPRRDGPRPMHISLRSGERLFLNGAVIRVDRKVTLELLNDATFLLENHVLQVEDTTTPLRQLYFAVQAMLMDPQNAEASRALFEAMAADMAATLRSDVLTEGIEEARAQVTGGRPFHALKTLRGLFAREAAILGEAASAPSARADARAGQGETPGARALPSASPAANAMPAAAPDAERPRPVATRDPTPFARDRIPGVPANDDGEGAPRPDAGEAGAEPPGPPLP